MISQMRWSAGADSAAPAMASTLSRLMTMSAMATIFTASQRLPPPATWSSSAASSLTSSLMAIQNSSRPPASFSQGTLKRNCTSTVKMMRRMTAAPAPSRMPKARWRRGRLRQASAMTTALSPDRTMLMPMILMTAIAVRAWAPNRDPNQLSHCSETVVCANTVAMLAIPASSIFLFPPAVFFLFLGPTCSRAVKDNAT